MTSIPEAEHRARVIDGLRLLATYLEDHPDVPVGGSDSFELSYCADVFADGGDAGHRAEVDRIAAVLDVDPITSPGGHYRVVKSFGGGVTYNAFTIPDAWMARHRAGSSYYDSVTLEGGAS